MSMPSSSEAVATSARSDPALRRCSASSRALARQAAVVAGDRVLAQDLRELRRDPLGHLPRVHEDERRAVLADEVGHPRVDLLPLLVRADGGERRGRDLDRQVERAEAARVHERALAPRADQEAADLVERLLRRREPDALDLAAAERLEPLEREGEVAAALVAHECVDLVDDHGAHVGQLGAAARAREQEVERLGRRDQDVRRAAGHRGPLRRRRVARPHQHPDLGQERLLGADLGQRPGQVLLDVVRKGPQRRDVEDLRLVGELRPLAQQRVDRREERGERLARARGRGDERVPSLADERPALALRRRRLAEPAREPALDRGMEGREGSHAAIIPGGMDRSGPPSDRTAGKGFGWMRALGAVN